MIIRMTITIIIAVTWKPEYAQQYTPQQSEWISKQKIPGTQNRCCSTADGDSEIQEDIRDGHYWARSRNTDNQWVQISDNAIINEPNELGHAIAWWAQDEYGNKIARCYVPGGKF